MLHWETSKQVKFRVEEQKKNNTQHRQPSLIYQYIAQEHHDMHWNNASILNKHQNTYSRKFLEACRTQVTHKVAADPSYCPQHIQQQCTTLLEILPP